MNNNKMKSIIARMILLGMFGIFAGSVVPTISVNAAETVAVDAETEETQTDETEETDEAATTAEDGIDGTLQESGEVTSASEGDSAQTTQQFMVVFLLGALLLIIIAVVLSVVSTFVSTIASVEDE